MHASLIMCEHLHYVFHYDNESLDHAFNTWFGTVHVVPLVIVWFLGGMKEM